MMCLVGFDVGFGGFCPFRLACCDALVGGLAIHQCVDAPMVRISAAEGSLGSPAIALQLPKLVGCWCMLAYVGFIPRISYHSLVGSVTDRLIRWVGHVNRHELHPAGWPDILSAEGSAAVNGWLVHQATGAGS